MKSYSPEFLTELTRRVFRAVGSPPEEAEIIADHLVLNGLMGVDSHGVGMIPKYVGWVHAGSVSPGAEISIVNEKSGTAIVDCGRNFGQVGALRATELAIENARAHKLSFVVTRNCAHVGRLGHFTQLAAEAGMFALAANNSPKPGHRVVPFGGLKGRIAPNPLSYAVPGRERPILADFGLSTIPFGRVVVAKNRGEAVPEDCLIDAEGHPTTDPAVMFRDPSGWLLPLGKNAGHKGFALLLLAEILGGTLAGTAMTDDIPDGRNGFCLLALDISAFLALDRFKELIVEMVHYVKSSPPAPGYSEVLLPGEKEFRTLEERKRTGIPIDLVTWRQITEAAESVGVRINEDSLE